MARASANGSACGLVTDQVGLFMATVDHVPSRSHWRLGARPVGEGSPALPSRLFWTTPCLDVLLRCHTQSPISTTLYKILPDSISAFF
jgi:hypothetical protein